MKEKVEAERATTNNLLEKMNTMEKRSKERSTELTKEHKAELKRARSNNDVGSGSGGYQTNDGGGERNHKKTRLQNSTFKERKATNRAKWEKRLAMKLDKPGSGWANKQERHNPDMINWGGYCHTHGYDPIGKAHDSANCNPRRNGAGAPANGHNKTATRTNRKGGSKENKPL